MKKQRSWTVLHRCLTTPAFVTAGWLLTGCPAPSSAPNETPPDETSGGGEPSGDDMNDSPGAGAEQGAMFTAITGAELFMEGASFDEAGGGFRRRDEQFASTFSLSPIDAETGQAFVVPLDGGEPVLVETISGRLEGQAHLAYSESGTDFTPEFDCPTSSYDGAVEWDVSVEGTYNFIPALRELGLQARAAEVSSPQYMVTFTSPGCPEFDSVSLSSYVWPGPGQGTWGFVTIQLRNGQFDSRLDNPLGNDLGETDFYQIHVETNP